MKAERFLADFDERIKAREEEAHLEAVEKRRQKKEAQRAAETGQEEEDEEEAPPVDDEMAQMGFGFTFGGSNKQV